MNDKKAYFEAEREQGLARARELGHLDGRYTLLRTAVFVLAVLSLAWGYDGRQAGWYLGPVLLLAFVWLVRRHAALRHLSAFVQDRLTAVGWYLARFSEEWQTSGTDGRGFIREGQPQAVDLHILGQCSFFQYMCRARTLPGREALAAVLSPVPGEREMILARQKAVGELMERPELCLDLSALAERLPEGHDLRPMTAEFLEPVRKAGGGAFLAAYHLRWGLPALLVLSAAAALAGAVPWSLTGWLLTLQLVLSLLALKGNQAELAPLLPLEQGMRAYAEIFARLERENFMSARLAEMAAGLRRVRASENLAALSSQVDAVLMRKNMLVFLLGNACLLWDSHLSARFLAWRQRNGREMSAWLADWAEMEMLLSLAVIGLTRKEVVFPELLAEESPLLQGRAVNSLLLPEEKGVANDADFLGESCIITGSNMSGKTTYLRTLAGTAVLAYAGAPVCAAAFKLTAMHIFTSIQVNDDLAQGISTFYAELLRVRKMVEFAREGRPMLVCIDEIFKGTNSADRIVGAEAAIERLTAPHILTLVTTHDFELCDLKAPDGTALRNFHFEEHYAGDKIEFDFRIKPGRCQTTNAQYLLRMAGILP